MLRTIDLLIVVFACIFVGYGAGFYFGARSQTKQNISLCAKGTDVYNDCLVNLKSCELTANTVEEELQDTRWNLGNCEHQVIEMVGQIERMSNMIFRNNSLE